MVKAFGLIQHRLIKSSMTDSLHPSYRPDIDGLRAVGILSVIIYHAFPETLRGGFIGVDIFFVISGYLISTIIFRSLEAGDFSYLVVPKISVTP